MAQIEKSFKALYEKSLHPQGRLEFWSEWADKIHWFKNYNKVLDDSNPPFYRWFTGGETNAGYNAIDRHVENGLANSPALHYESAYTGDVKTYSFKEAQTEIAKLARVISDQGVKKGDRVIIYMPMIPQAYFAIHACIRIGAVHSVVFGGFASEELASRIKHADAKLIITASCG